MPQRDSSLRSYLEVVMHRRIATALSLSHSEYYRFQLENFRRFSKNSIVANLLKHFFSLNKDCMRIDQKKSVKISDCNMLQG